MNTDPAPTGAAGQHPPEPAEPELPELPDELAALCAAEAAAIAARRQQVLGVASTNLTELNLPRVGLALSGGAMGCPAPRP